MSTPTGYADLGVRPFINCRGNATAIGGSIMPEPVLEAMRQAAGSFVALETLQERIGERLARRIGVEGPWSPAALPAACSRLRPPA